MMSLSSYSLFICSFFFFFFFLFSFLFFVCFFVFFFSFHSVLFFFFFFFFFQAEDGIRDGRVTGVQTCALPIYVYREFEIAPTGDWVDLAIDRNRDIYDADWNSGWQRQGRIDEKNHTWYAGARVPLHSVSEKKVAAGTTWRVNLYRIDGLGADPQRRFLCWQPTCVVNRDPNHVPEHFGTLVFTR